MSSKVLTVAELAEYLRVHRSTIYRLLKALKLPAFRIGSDWRFNREQIDEWRLKQAVLAENRSPRRLVVGTQSYEPRPPDTRGVRKH
ncbi:MAG: helix-turn-helix domain-containing protein [Candidatus Binataceae bacterium]